MADPTSPEQPTSSEPPADPAVIAALEHAVRDARQQYVALRATLTRIVDR